VRVHYRGTFPDGREFDSSLARGQPAEFPLNRVIKCWTEGVQKMKVGGKAKLTCPPALAYGERGAGGSIPPNATLHFEIELLAIK
jgi:FKBP-type peptidyl-prolyl cis-trans isomerase FkpA